MKILLKVLLLTAPINFAYTAEGQKSAGLPDGYCYISISIILACNYVFTFIPVHVEICNTKVRCNNRRRRDKISNDINDADNLNTEATDILKKYDEQMASASQESNEIITNSKKAMLDHLEMLKKENEEKVNSLISEVSS